MKVQIVEDKLILENQFKASRFCRKMDTIKKPEMLLGLGNTVAIVGLGIYFHKQLNVLKSEHIELSEHLKTSVKKFAEIQGDSISRAEVNQILQVLTGKIETTDRKVQSLGQGEDLEVLEEALETLADLLEESGIEWDYPPRRGRRSKRRGGGGKKRRPKRRDYSSSSEEEESDSEETDVDKAIEKVRRKRKGGKRNK